MKFLRVQWDRSVAIGALLLGALALYLGYHGVSGTAFVAEQLPYFVSGGLAGIFLLGIAGISWISADLRDEWRELRALRDQLDAMGPALADMSTTNGSDETGPNGRRRLRAGTGTRSGSSA